MADMLQPDLFEPLNMHNSFYDVPKNLSNAVLPGGAEESGFVLELGNETP